MLSSTDRQKAMHEVLGYANTTVLSDQYISCLGKADTWTHEYCRVFVSKRTPAIGPGSNLVNINRAGSPRVTYAYKINILALRAS